LGWVNRFIAPDSDWAKKMAAASCVTAPPEQRTATESKPKRANVVRNV